MISRRLQLIGSLVPKDKSVADIGCDHGFLAIWLKNHGHTGKIICSDYRVGPLENCLRNLLAWGYNDVETILSDGATMLPPCEVAVLAGMGEATAIHIMSSSPEFFADCLTIIQVNRNVNVLRKWLMTNGYRIIDERIIKDYKYYEILIVEKGEMTLSEDEINYGPYLLKERSEIFLMCWQQKRDKLAGIRDSLAEGHPDRRHLDEQISEIDRIIGKGE